MRFATARAVSSSVASIVVIVLVVAAGLGFYALSARNPPGGPSVSSSPSSFQTSSLSSSSPASTTQASQSTRASQASNTGQSVCGTPAPGAKTVSVSMAAGSNQPFSPETVVVVIGVNNTVMWTNDDMTGDMHTVTSRTGLFDSGSMSAGAIFTCAFSTAGSYDYFSKNNPSMVGTVTVKSP